jgi:secreted PhoX family phosphatase
VWVYDTRRDTLTLLFESPSPDVLDLPDNMTISPRGSVLLCEDGESFNYVRGINRRGQTFDFALNAMRGSTDEEFAGATFSPSGKTLFVNIQFETALTFAIWGPFGKGAL